MNSRNQIGRSLRSKLKYAANCLPSYAWQQLTRRSEQGTVHLILTIADHFEPSGLTDFLAGYAPRDVQE
jgi:hypothetical protein